MFRTSSVLESLPSSGIRQIFDLAVQMERAGRPIVRFDIGRPDFETPTVVVESAKQALDQGFTKYVSNRGIPELLRAIADKLDRENGADYDPDSEILVTTGASEGVAAAIFAVLERGAELLLPGPLWPHYACCARMVGATPVEIPLRVEDGFAITRELLERYVTPRTRMVVLNNPCNPTGVVYPNETLKEVLAFARERGIFVLADEMYEPFAFDSKPTSFAALPGAKEVTLLVHGFSKAYGMTGWRLGYVAGPARLVGLVNKAHQYLTVCATSFAQKGAATAYTAPAAAEFVARVVADFKDRRDALLDEMTGVTELQYARPAGAFYFFPRLPASVPSGEEFALRLLRESGVAVVPGGVFGAAYRRFVRLSYGATPPAVLREGLRKIVNQLREERLAA